MLESPASEFGYKQLDVWKKSMGLAQKVYEVTRDFPPDERFGLVSQMRRAAVSIPANVAEGHARHTSREFINFISHAQGSTAELETQVLLAGELGFMPVESVTQCQQIVNDVARRLFKLRRRLGEKVRAAAGDTSNC